MTTLSNFEDMKNLVDAFVKDDISEEQFYSRLRELVAGDPEELDDLIAYLKRLIEQQ